MGYAGDIDNTRYTVLCCVWKHFIAVQEGLQLQACCVVPHSRLAASCRTVDTSSHESARLSIDNSKSVPVSHRMSAGVQDHEGSEQADLLELQLLDVLA